MASIEVSEGRGEDAEALVELWESALRRVCPSQQLDDIRHTIALAAEDDDSCVLVARNGGTIVGAVHLRVVPISPVNPDLCVHAFPLRVTSGELGNAAGQALLLATANFAETRGIPEIASAARATARDENRFLARWGFAGAAMVRAVPVSALRAKLAPARSSSLFSAKRDRIIAARRRRGVRVNEAS